MLLCVSLPHFRPKDKARPYFCINYYKYCSAICRFGHNFSVVFKHHGNSNYGSSGHDGDGASWLCYRLGQPALDWVPTRNDCGMLHGLFDCAPGLEVDDEEDAVEVSWLR